MSDVLTRVRDARVGYEPNPVAEANARRRLEHSIELALVAHPLRARRRRLAVVIGVAVALAGVLVVIVSLLPGRTGAPVNANASKACAARSTARCLEALSVIAAGEPSPAAPVLYRRNRYVQAVKRFGPPGRQDPARYASLPGAQRVFQVERSVNEDLWVVPDGSGRVAYGTQGPARPASAWDAAAWRQAGAPALERLLPWSRGVFPRTYQVPASQSVEFFLGGNGLARSLPDRDPLSVVPVERRALRAWLLRAAWRQRVPRSQRAMCDSRLQGCSWALRHLITDTAAGDATALLRYPHTPPQLRASLMLALGDIGGVRLLGIHEDPRGRLAVVIRIGQSLNDGLDVIAFDPKSSALLAEGSAAAGDRVVGIRWSRIYSIVERHVEKVGRR
jgi:hypothetical protein